MDAAEKCIEALSRQRHLHPSFSKVVLFSLLGTITYVFISAANPQDPRDGLRFVLRFVLDRCRRERLWGHFDWQEGRGEFVVIHDEDGEAERREFDEFVL